MRCRDFAFGKFQVDHGVGLARLLHGAPRNANGMKILAAAAGGIDYVSTGGALSRMARRLKEDALLMKKSGKSEPKCQKPRCDRCFPIIAGGHAACLGSKPVKWELFHLGRDRGQTAAEPQRLQIMHRQLAELRVGMLAEGVSWDIPRGIPGRRRTASVELRIKAP